MLQHNLIETFFDREVNRVRYVTKRIQLRTQEKKAMDDKEAAIRVRQRYIETFGGLNGFIRLQLQQQQLYQNQLGLGQGGGTVNAGRPPDARDDLAARDREALEAAQKAALEEAKLESDYQQMLREFRDFLIEGKGTGPAAYVDPPANTRDRDFARERKEKSLL